jgi:hypothetical protein
MMFDPACTGKAKSISPAARFPEIQDGFGLSK